jgi:type 1 glutamine amidotransferase
MLAAAALSAAVALSPFARAADAPAKPARPNAADIAKITAALPEKAQAMPKSPRKVLIYTKATGFVHSSIPFGAKTFELMGEKTGAYTAVDTDDAEAFMPDNLKQYDAILLMSTTGSLFVPKGAKEELMFKPGAGELPADVAHAKVLRDSLINFVKSGKGLMGIHAATDSSYQWTEFGEMIGGQFNGHPWGKISIRNEDPTNPVNAAFDGKGFEFSDEIYTFKKTYSRERQHILLSIDLAASKIESGINRPEDQDYAVSWLNHVGQGRVFYSLLGHREDTYSSPAVLKHFLAGLQYALGDLEANDKPSGPLSPERLAENLAAAKYASVDVLKNDKAYKDQKAKEETFSGTLEAIANAGGPTTLQRAAFYKLGDKTIYTGGKKNAALDAMVGKKVDIKGKAVSMELEGKQVNEIWPASVKPAKN